ncbi:MAG: hypothetical protein HQL17_03980 [Candidatus Omnitrophica bacterium]|nr:hypothetical protein [Candidatus Omnitrophota bacterium]
MRNKFLKFIPSILIVIALALLFIPKTVTYLSVEKFFADTDAYYQSADKNIFKQNEARRQDYYYPGVRIGKLWKKIGIGKTAVLKDAHAVALRDEYLFGCSFSDNSACILPYPVIQEYELGDYRVMRVSSQSLRFPDYQYLIFKGVSGSWGYVGHIDVFDNKKAEPVFRLMDKGLVSVISLAGSGNGYSTKFIQVYSVDENKTRLLMATPSEAFRRGLGLLDFDVTSSFDYVNGVLVGNYKISFLAEQVLHSGEKRSLPLFTISRYMTFQWDGQALTQDPTRSDINSKEVARIISGSYGHVYTMFKADFDKLQKADGIKKEWFEKFLDVVKEEGFSAEISVTLPKVHQPL